MFSIWMVTAVLAAAASTDAGYEYKVPNAPFGGSHSNAAYSTQGSTSYGYGHRPGSNYVASSNVGYNSGFGNYDNHGSSVNTVTGLSNTGAYVQNVPSFGTDSHKKYASGVESSYNSGYYQPNTVSTTGSGSGYYQTGLGSNIASGSGYNVLSGSSQSTYNTGASSSGSASGIGSNGYYGSTGSAGSSHSYGTGSGHQLTEYQSTYESTSDTSGIDKIGSHYESASASQYHSSNQYHSGNKEYYFQNSQQPTQVFKHFYVLSAPEEPETVRHRQPIVLPPPQKHYKIIFIKAPSQPAPAPQIINVPQQNEEKTIVYVLVKKPEDVKNIALPKFESKAPTKPEVFFIKYNDKSDSQALINNIVNDYNKGGVKTTFSNVNVGSNGAQFAETGPITMSDETSGSLDSILASDQSLITGEAESSSQFNEGTTILGNKDSSIIATDSGTTLQSTSNQGVGSIYVPFRETSFGSNSGYDAYNKDKTSVNNAVGLSTSESAVEDFDNRFNTNNEASTLNQDIGNTFAAILNDDTNSVPSITSSSIESSQLDVSSGVDTGSGNHSPSTLYGLGSSTAFGSDVNTASNAAASSASYNSGTSYNTVKPSVSFGTNYNNLVSSGGSGSYSPFSLGSGVSTTSSNGLNNFSSTGSDVNTYNQNNIPYNSFGSTTANVLSSSAESSYDSSLVSQSQGVPHETYGPPKFKVF